jgi:two-component system sensor histidine kinase PilS (NtrC family)
MVVIFQDVTEVVGLEEELRRNARLAGVGQLAADIAHEIRNPLAAISGSIEVLRSEQPPEPKGEGGRLMEIVLREVDRLNALITDFLQYARPAPPKLEAIRVTELLGEVVEVFRVGAAPEVGVEIETGGALQVEGDEAQLRQVVWNLLQNAAQAIEGEGSIRVAARSVPAAQAPLRDGRSAQRDESLVVEIAVTDNGRGIDPEVAERVFDPFFTTKRGGTGLGLATVHRIVESHSGVVQLESRQGEGTTVRILLPGECCA